MKQKTGCCAAAAILLLAAVLLAAFVKFLDVQTAKDWYENAVNFVSRFSLTSSFRLAGARSFGENSYTGSYKADCQGQNSTEAVFGGASTREHKICIEGDTRKSAGKIVLILETGGTSREILPDADGKIAQTVTFTGSSRVKLQYRDFTGTVHLTLTEQTA